MSSSVAAVSDEFHISRYPTTQIDVWHLRNGTRLTLRPVLPQDGPLLGDLVDRLSPYARGERFHGGVRHLSAEQLETMAHIDYQRHMAFVVSVGQGKDEQIVADARYHIDGADEPHSAEFAVMVDDRWQRIGLGTRAMLALIQVAGEAGLHWLHGDVRAHNQRMLALLRRCQFFCTPNPWDENLIHAEVSLRRDATQRALSANRANRPAAAAAAAAAAAKLWRWVSRPAPLSALPVPTTSMPSHHPAATGESRA
jgi:RimJ/RimL family protein N-acetyltransferase